MSKLFLGAVGGSLSSAEDQKISAEIILNQHNEQMKIDEANRARGRNNMKAAGIYQALLETMPKWKKGSKKTIALVNELKAIADQLAGVEL